MLSQCCSGCGGGRRFPLQPFQPRSLELLFDWKTRALSTKRERGVRDEKVMVAKGKKEGRERKVEEEGRVDPRPRSTVSAWPLSLRARPPVAPGMFTYRFPMNVFASGILRFGGVALGAGFTGVVLCSSALYAATARKLGWFITAFGESVPRPLVCAGKMCVCFPLLGHFLGGLRDIGWHMGIQSLEKGYCQGTSLGIVVLSLAGSGALAFARFPEGTGVPKAKPKAK